MKWEAAGDNSHHDQKCHLCMNTEPDTDRGGQAVCKMTTTTGIQ